MKLVLLLDGSARNSARAKQILEAMKQESELEPYLRRLEVIDVRTEPTSAHLQSRYAFPTLLRRHNGKELSFSGNFDDETLLRNFVRGLIGANIHCNLRDAA